MIADGRIACPLKGVVWYSKGLVHNGSHFIDLMRFWLGDVHSMNTICSGRHWNQVDPEPDFILKHERGTIAYLAAREEFFSHYTVELIATNGRLYYSRGGESICWQPLKSDPEFPGYTVLDSSPRLLACDMYRYQLHILNQLSKALDGETSTLCTGDDALATMNDVFRVIEQSGERS